MVLGIKAQTLLDCIFRAATSIVVGDEKKMRDVGKFRNAPSVLAKMVESHQKTFDNRVAFACPDQNRCQRTPFSFPLYGTAGQLAAEIEE